MSDLYEMSRAVRQRLDRALSPAGWNVVDILPSDVEILLGALDKATRRLSEARAARQDAEARAARLAEVVREAQREAWSQAAQTARHRGWLVALAANPYHDPPKIDNPCACGSLSLDDTLSDRHDRGLHGEERCSGDLRAALASPASVPETRATGSPADAGAEVESTPDAAGPGEGLS